MKQPLVTVFTLIYNTNPRYVIEAIKSIRANNYPNLQHIIIDDCSPDPTPKETVKKWMAENNYSCEFFEHHVNFGLCKTLNHVLELTKGKYLFGCSDDLISSNKIWEDVQILENSSVKVGAIYSEAELINAAGEKLKGSFVKNLLQVDSYPSGDIFELLVQKNFLPAMSVMWKTSVFDAVGKFDENLAYEDYDMSLRVFKNLDILFNSTSTVSYRVHDESLVGKLSNHDLQNSILFRKHASEKKSCKTRWKKEMHHFLLHNEIEFIQEKYNLVASCGLTQVRFAKKIPSHRLRNLTLHILFLFSMIKP